MACAWIGVGIAMALLGDGAKNGFAEGEIGKLVQWSTFRMSKPGADATQCAARLPKRCREDDPREMGCLVMKRMKTEAGSLSEGRFHAAWVERLGRRCRSRPGIWAENVGKSRAPLENGRGRPRNVP